MIQLGTDSFYRTSSFNGPRQKCCGCNSTNTSSSRSINAALSVQESCGCSTKPPLHPSLLLLVILTDLFTCHLSVGASAGEANQLQLLQAECEADAAVNGSKSLLEAKCFCWFQHLRSQHNKLCIPPPPPAGFPDTHCFSVEMCALFTKSNNFISCIFLFTLSLLRMCRSVLLCFLFNNSLTCNATESNAVLNKHD